MAYHVSTNSTSVPFSNVSTNLLLTINKDPLRTIFSVLNLVASIAILGVNIPILIIGCSKTSLLRSVSNKILFSLVISDILTGVMALLNLTPRVFQKLDGVYSFFVFLDLGTLWLQLSMMSNLTFIIFERYYSVVHPYTVGIYFSSLNVIRGIKTLWVTTFMYPCVQLIWLYKVLDGNWTAKEDEYIKKADSIFSILSVIIFFLIPVLMLAFLFIRMYHEIKKIPVLDITKKRKSHKRVLSTFATMYVLYVILSLPYFLIRLLLDIGSISNYKVPYSFMATTYLLKLLPPIIDPFVYIFKKPDFKRELLAKTDELKDLFNSVGNSEEKNKLGTNRRSLTKL